MLCCLHALCSTSLSPLPKNSMWIRIRKQLQVDGCAEITSNREWLSIYRSKTSDSCIIPQVSLSRGKCRPRQFCFQRQRRMTRIFVVHGRHKSLPRPSLGLNVKIWLFYFPDTSNFLFSKSCFKFDATCNYAYFPSGHRMKREAVMNPSLTKVEIR